MRHVDFEAHNADVEAVWRACKQGAPITAPMIPGINVHHPMWRPDATPDQQVRWFECPIRFFAAEVPDTEPILAEDTSEHQLLEGGILHRFKGGPMRRDGEMASCS